MLISWGYGREETQVLLPLEYSAFVWAALFGWLRGREGDVPGWQADLSRQGEGRISARRSTPLPTAELRVVFAP